MRKADIPEVLALERNTLNAWSLEHLKDELRQPAGFQFVVRQEATEEVLAYICGRLAADEAEILKLNVLKNARQKGFGYKLLDFALNYCREKGARNCFLELRASNIAAKNLYEKKGFFRIGTRRNYYDSPVEDAIVMQLEL